MQKFVKNILFLLFFVSFAGGVFYMSTSQDFLHFTEKAFLGEVLKEAKNRVLTRDFSIELEGADEEEIL